MLGECHSSGGRNINIAPTHQRQLREVPGLVLGVLGDVDDVVLQGRGG